MFTPPFIQTYIKESSSASLAFVRGIHRSLVNSPRKWPVTRKVFPFDDVIMSHDTDLILTEFLRSLSQNGYTIPHKYNFLISWETFDTQYTLHCKYRLGFQSINFAHYFQIVTIDIHTTNTILDDLTSTVVNRPHIIITITSQECYGVSNHCQFDCLSIRLLKLRTKTQTPKFLNTNLPGPQ